MASNNQEHGKQWASKTSSNCCPAAAEDHLFASPGTAGLASKQEVRELRRMIEDLQTEVASLSNSIQIRHRCFDEEETKRLQPEMYDGLPDDKVLDSFESSLKRLLEKRGIDLNSDNALIEAGSYLSGVAWNYWKDVSKKKGHLIHGIDDMMMLLRKRFLPNDQIVDEVSRANRAQTSIWLTSMSYSRRTIPKGWRT
eukprot:GHVS01057434.1.p1 GENE.GHVS01057434.1~~GHVS01057434.1.p1  ORF type:complete len:197 (+),score=17.21 GHVS01057434.1:313-903(+)